jgi:hypothetical protein
LITLEQLPQAIKMAMFAHEKGRPAILILDDIKAILTHVDEEEKS